MRLCNYCQAGMAILPTLELGEHVFCDEDCAAKRIAELEAENARLRAALAAAEAEARVSEWLEFEPPS